MPLLFSRLLFFFFFFVLTKYGKPRFYPVLLKKKKKIIGYFKGLPKFVKGNLFLSPHPQVIPPQPKGEKPIRQLGSKTHPRLWELFRGNQGWGKKNPSNLGHNFSVDLQTFRAFKGNRGKFCWTQKVWAFLPF